MPKVTLKDAQSFKRGQLRSWAYNTIDCIATREVADTLLPRMSPKQDRYYRFCLAAQTPAFAMTQRGILVDQQERSAAVNKLNEELRGVIRSLNDTWEIRTLWDKLEKVTGACPKATRKDGKHKWPRGVADTPERTCEDCGASRFRKAPFNPNSPDQVDHLLFELLGLKRQKNKKGEYSADEDVLDSLRRKYAKAAELCTLILDARGLRKQIGFLKARLTAEGRYVSQFSVGTPWTGRWSSHKRNGYGGNSQNVAERHRSIFKADPGMELCYMDLKQAESNIVAHLAGCERYIEAHELGDVHTYVTRLVWPDLGWTWDLKQDKAIAKQNPEWDPAPGHEYRFQAKRIQHGGNYGMTPFGIASWAHIPLYAAREAYNSYHGEFDIMPWQKDIARRVRNRDALVFPLGFEVKLFGRPWDDSTVKQGLALLPQGTVAHIINIVAWRLWQEMDPGEIELLAQVHDAVMFQFPKGQLDTVRKAAALARIPLEVGDIHGNIRTTTIDVEAAVGRNWGKRSEENPNGLEEVEV